MKQLKLFGTEDILKFRRKQTLQYDDFTIRKDECAYTDKEGDRALFGVGFLISDRKAEELAEARLKNDRTDSLKVIEIPLNGEQRAIVERLNEKAR